MLLAVGASIDFIRAYNSRTELQSAADSAVLAAAAKYKSGMPEAKIAKTIDAFLSANGEFETAVAGKPEVASDESELCVDVTDAVPTTFMNLANIQSVPIGIRSCAALPGVKQLEIALVLDVSSSMLEENRFTPMQTAVAGFLQAFSSNASLVDKTKISIVPFSSRVNFGLANTGWLKSYNGTAAVPKRWTDPKSVYSSSSYKLSYWVDGVTPVMSTSKNYYWMGCIEPRADVEVRDTGAIGDGMGDAPPGTSAFVAMDANPKSGTSFCPPPVTPLTGDFAYLKRRQPDLRRLHPAGRGCGRRMVYAVAEMAGCMGRPILTRTDLRFRAQGHGVHDRWRNEHQIRPKRQVRLDLLANSIVGMQRIRHRRDADRMHGDEEERHRNLYAFLQHRCRRGEYPQLRHQYRPFLHRITGHHQDRL
ncbi:UNVERIFIED_ORG: Flp pilus assembly protein TadG [Rhizobium esperanzae]